MAQWLAQDPYKIKVVGSSPVTSTKICCRRLNGIGHYTFNVEDASSSLVSNTQEETLVRAQSGAYGPGSIVG